MEGITGFISCFKIEDACLEIELNCAGKIIIIEVDVNIKHQNNNDSKEKDLIDLEKTLSAMVENKQAVKFKNGYLLPLKKSR